MTTPDHSTRPNVVFLFSDQHNARVLGCYGDSQAKTPHLDALAANGVLLQNAMCNNPICTPSRLCFLSGQYAHNHGHYGLMGPNPTHLPSLFTFFRRHGYTTGAFGKIHTPVGWLSRDADQLRDIAAREEAPSTNDNPKNQYDQFLAVRNEAHLRDDTIIPEWLKAKGRGHGQGVDARPSDLSPDATAEAWAAQQAIDFISEAKAQDRPFCCWMSVPRPHQTYLPARSFWERYRTEQFMLPPNASDDMTGRSPAARETQQEFQKETDWMAFEPRDWESARRRVLHGYYGCVSQVDDACGRVISHLEKLKLRENTIVIYSSDHGEFAGEHGMIEKAPGIGFRCVTRIPMIWSFPGKLPAGLSRTGLAESVDVLPTLAALAGLPAPDWVDGADLTPLLREGREVKSVTVCEAPLARTIFDGRYKFTQHPPETVDGEDFGELYDNQEDPWEKKNLYRDPLHRPTVERLRYQLYLWLVRTLRPVTANPWPMPQPGETGQRPWSLDGKDYAEDGRIGYRELERFIANGHRNYL